MTLSEIGNKYSLPVTVTCNKPGYPNFELIGQSPDGKVFYVKYHDKGQPTEISACPWINDYEVVEK